MSGKHRVVVEYDFGKESKNFWFDTSTEANAFALGIRTAPRDDMSVAAVEWCNDAKIRWIENQAVLEKTFGMKLVEDGDQNK